MSEYITINTEATDDEDILIVQTNQRLTLEDEEVYLDAAHGEEGSPLAQTLFAIDGLQALTIEDQHLVIRRDPTVEWYVLIDEISAALKDFFL